MRKQHTGFRLLPSRVVHVRIAMTRRCVRRVLALSDRQNRRTDRMTGIRTIGVIGAGQMGNGIAHVCALAGFDVLLT